MRTLSPYHALDRFKPQGLEPPPRDYFPYLFIFRALEKLGRADAEPRCSKSPPFLLKRGGACLVVFRRIFDSVYP